MYVHLGEMSTEVRGITSSGVEVTSEPPIVSAGNHHGSSVFLQLQRTAYKVVIS